MYFSRHAFLGQIPLAGIPRRLGQFAGYVPPGGSMAEPSPFDRAANDICDKIKEYNKAKPEEKGSWEKSIISTAKAYSRDVSSQRAVLMTGMNNCGDIVPLRLWERWVRMVDPNYTPPAPPPTAQTRPTTPTGMAPPMLPEIPTLPSIPTETAMAPTAPEVAPPTLPWAAPAPTAATPRPFAVDESGVLRREETAPSAEAVPSVYCDPLKGEFPAYPGGPCRTGVATGGLPGLPGLLAPTGGIQAPQFGMGRTIRVANLVRRPALSGQQDDIAWFEANRINLARQYAGQWLIVKDQAVHGAYPDFQSAYNAGVAAFGTQPFLVKQAIEKETPIRMTGRWR